MKAKIKKIVYPLFLSVLCGFICGRLMFSIYEDKESSILSSNIIYLLEDGSYDDYDSMKASSLSSNYIYYKENDKYNTVVALTKNKDNIDVIEKVYNKDLKVTEYLINNQNINAKIDEYDTMLKNTKEDGKLKEIIMQMIEVYKDEEDTKVAKIG